jgi:hypothetical protein
MLGGTMMPSLVRTLSAVAALGSVMAVPAGSIAAAQPAIPSPTVQQASAAAATNPWLALSAMTSSSGAASAAATQGDATVGPPPVAPLMVILGTIALAVWILIGDNDGDFNLTEEPVSP